MRLRRWQMAVVLALVALMVLGCPKKKKRYSSSDDDSSGSSSSSSTTSSTSTSTGKTTPPKRGSAPPLEGLDTGKFTSRYTVKDAKEVTVPSSGGKVEYDKLAVEFAPGTVDKDVKANVAVVANPDGFLAKDTVSLSPAYEVNVPAGLKKEPKVTIKFDPDKVPQDCDIRNVRVFWNGYGEWIPLPSELNLDDNTVSASVPHFSQVDAAVQMPDFGGDEVQLAGRAVTMPGMDTQKIVTVYYAIPTPGLTSPRTLKRGIEDTDRNGLPQYVDRIVNAITKARKVYESYGFRQPKTVEVYIDDLKVDGYVDKITGTFYLSSNVAEDADLDAAAAHEYFHVVQQEYASGLTWALRHYWLAEATAFWAETMVFPEYGASRATIYSDRNMFSNLTRPLTITAYATAAATVEQFSGGGNFSSDVFYASAPFFMFMEKRTPGFTHKVFDALKESGGSDIDLVKSVTTVNSDIAPYAAQYFYYQDLPGFSQKDLTTSARSIVQKDYLLTLTRDEPVKVVSCNLYALSSIPFYLFAFDDAANPAFSGTVVIKASGSGVTPILNCFPERNGHRLAFGERGKPSFQGTRVPDMPPADIGWSRADFGSFKMPGVGCDTVAFLVTGTGEPWTSGNVSVIAYILDGPAGGRWDVTQKNSKNVYKITWASTPLFKNETVKKMLKEYAVYKRTPDKPFDKPIARVELADGELSFIDENSNGEDPLIYGVQLTDTGGNSSPIREIAVRLIDLTPFKLTNEDTGMMESVEQSRFEQGGFAQQFMQTMAIQPPNSVIRYMLVDTRALKRYSPDYSEQKLIDEFQAFREKASKEPNPMGDVRVISDIQSTGAKFKYLMLKVTDSVKPEAETTKFTQSNVVALIFWSEKLGVLGGVTLGSQGKYELKQTEDKPPKLVFKSKDNPPFNVEECETKARALMNLVIGRIERTLKDTK